MGMIRLKLAMVVTEVAHNRVRTHIPQADSQLNCEEMLLRNTARPFLFNLCSIMVVGGVKYKTQKPLCKKEKKKKNRRTCHLRGGTHILLKC